MDIFLAPCNFHVESTWTVHDGLSTRKSTRIVCCLSTWQRRVFYGLFLSGYLTVTAR